jgi:hypothetical protein
MSTAILPLNIAALRVNTNDASALTSQFKGRMARFERAPTSSTGDQLLQPLADPSGPANPLGVGVHLHWQLPEPFARGQQPALDSAFTFPPAPNRWLVIRYLSMSDPTGGSTAAILTQRWIVESDAILPALASDKYGIVRPAVPVPLATDQSGVPSFRYLGRALPYDDWRAGTTPVPHLGDFAGPDGKPLQLSSVGFVGPGFSAYYPECCSVFGFWDTFADVPGLREQMLENAPVRFSASYQVIGWIDDAAADPLAGLPAAASADYTARVRQCLAAGVAVDLDPADAVSDVLDREHRMALRPDAVTFTLGPDHDVQTLDAPSRTLCAGIFQDLVWDTTANPATTFFLANPADPRNPTQPWSDTVRVAAGTTAVEGLSALLRSELDGSVGDDTDVLDNSELLLNALQLGLLSGIESKTDRIVDLEEMLHASGFGRVPGGLLWLIQPPGTDPKGDEQVTLPLMLAEKLAALNTAQQAYDDARAGVDILRRQLFLDWFRYIKLYLGDATDPNVDLNALVRFLASELSATVAAGHAAGLLPIQRDLLTQQVTGIDQPPTSGTLAAAAWAAHQDTEAALPPGGWTLQAVPAPPYWLPNDPVLVLDGQRVEPARRNGSADRTPVRIGADLLDRLVITAGDASFTVPAADVATFPTASPAMPARAEVNGLIGEAALLVPTLTPSCADAVAAAGGAGNPAVADRDGFVAALRSAVGGVNPLSGPLTGLYAAVRSPDYPGTVNPVQTAAGPPQLTVSFDNGSAAAYPPSPVGWTAPELRTEFSPTRLDPLLPVFLTWQGAFVPLQRRAGQDYTPDNLTAFFGLDTDGVDSTYLVAGGAPVGFTTGVPVTYAGSTVLSTRATTNLARQIDAYLSDHPDDPAADELQQIRALFVSRRILSQGLGGFTLQQTLHATIPTAPVQDLRRRRQDAVTTSIAAAAADPADDWNRSGFTNQAPIPTGPLAQQNFGPLRAGTLTITQLEVVDAFGQRILLETPGQQQPLQVIAADSVRPHPADTVNANALVLPPRFGLPARIWFRWLSAAAGPGDFVESNSHPATTPVFGWVVPNHLDDSLAIYDADGSPIGSFGLEHANRVYRSRPGNAGNPGDDLAVDIGAPGRPTVNPQLATVMWAIQLASDGFLADLMATVLTSESWIQPAGGDQDAALAVLIGRPLALTRAVLEAQTPGGLLPLNPADTGPQAPFPRDVRAQRYRYADRQATSSASLATVRIPVRVGDVANLDDGTVGYFVARTTGDVASPFYSPYAPSGGADGVLQPRPEPINLTLNSAPTVLVLLVDPRAGVHATTGVLPVEQLSIPPDQYELALRSLAVTFPTHPVLHGQSELVIPVPRIGGYDWSWVPPAGPVLPLRSNAADGSASTGYSPQAVDEGWLQLRPDSPDPSKE